MSFILLPALLLTFISTFEITLVELDRWCAQFTPSVVRHKAVSVCYHMNLLVEEDEPG